MDDETQRQLAELRDEIVAVARIRDAHKRRLYVLQEQTAQQGILAPAVLITECVDIGVAIRAADVQLAEFRRLVVRLEQAPPSVLTLPDRAPYLPVLDPTLVNGQLRELGGAIVRMGDAIADLHELDDLAREESREWRAAQRSTDRAFRIGGAVVLLLLTIAVVVLLIQVF